MLAVYVPLQKAENVKKKLQRRKLFHPDYLPVKEMGFIYFPLLRRCRVPSVKVVETKFLFPLKIKPLDVKEILKGKLTEREMSLLPQTQEIVGQILILDIPLQLKRKEKIIAEAYLQIHKNITTVVKKSDIHSGVYRTRKVVVLAGKNTKEAVHAENGVKIKLDLEKVYFSARSANERLRIAKQVKDREDVLVLFSGVAPFPLVIAKNSSAHKVYGIELNLLAHQYALENVQMNKLEDKVIIYLGDARVVAHRLKLKFDRVVMPLPKTGETFLDIALRVVKPRGMIHLYAFLRDHEIIPEAKKIKKICEKYHSPVRVMRKVKCGQFSPGTFRVCFDLKLV